MTWEPTATTPFDWRKRYEESRLRPVLVWGFLLIAYLYPSFLFNIHNPNERVRLYMTVAMVDHQTFAIGRREAVGRASGNFRDQGLVHDRWGYVNDRALTCDDPALSPPDCEGTLYSAKAPGISFLGVIPYALLSGLSELLDRELSIDVILWFLRLVVVVLPTLLMLWWFRRLGRHLEVDPVLLDLVTMGVGVGSMVYTYGHMFAGHQVCAYLLFFSLVAAVKSHSDGRWIWPFLGGLSGGLAVATEYPMLLVFLAMFGVQLVTRRRWSTFLWFGAGALAPALLAAWFHQVAFGKPWKTAYSTLENVQFVKDIDYGFMGLRSPSWENIQGTFFGSTLGMFFYAPWLALILPSPLLWWASSRRGGESGWLRSVAFFASLVAVAMLVLFISCHSLWRSGWTVGPRYIVPFVPFAGLAILLALDGLRQQRWARWVVGTLVGGSMLVTGASSMVSQGFGFGFHNPVNELVIPLLREGYVTWNPGYLLGLDGLWTLFPLWGAGVAALCYVLQSGFSSPHVSWAGRWFLMSLSILGSVLILRAVALPVVPVNGKILDGRAFVRQHFFVGGFENRDLKRRRFKEQVAGVFPSLPEFRAGKMATRAVDGDCGSAAGLLGAQVIGEEESFRGVLVQSVLGAVTPLPMSLVTPVFLRPEGKVSESALKKLEK